MQVAMRIGMMLIRMMRIGMIIEIEIGAQIEQKSVYWD